MNGMLILAARADLWPEFEAQLRRCLPDFPHPCTIEHGSFDDLVVENSTGSVWLDQPLSGPALFADVVLEPEDVEQIYRELPQPVGYYLAYKGPALIRRVLRCIDNRSDILIDNFAGVRLPGPAFVARLVAEPDWDWFA